MTRLLVLIAFAVICIMFACDENDSEVLPDPYKLVLISGNNQEGSCGEELEESIIIQVQEEDGTPCPKVSVFFMTGDGTLNKEEELSDSDGKVSVKWTLGYTPGDQEMQAKAYTQKNDGSVEDELYNSPLKIEATAEKEEGVITDIDGNDYNIVKIGDQWWMAENLKTTKYADGTSLTELTDLNNDGSTNDEWYDGINSCLYDSYSGEIYYNYTAATHNQFTSGKVQGVCPTGWHLPDSTEWEILIKTVRAKYNKNEAALGLKAKYGWPEGKCGNDDYGFEALPTGAKNGTGDIFTGETGSWWSSTNDEQNLADHWSIGSVDNRVLRGSTSYNVGYTVRCVKD